MAKGHNGLGRAGIRLGRQQTALAEERDGLAKEDNCFVNSGSGVSKRAKPRGVTACQIFAAASPTRITDPTLLPLKILATKSPVIVLFDASEANLPAYFAARWGVQTGGVSGLVADRELYGSDRRLSGAPLAEKRPLQRPADSLRAASGRYFFYSKTFLVGGTQDPARSWSC